MKEAGVVIWAGAAAAGVALISQLLLSGRRDSHRKSPDAASDVNGIQIRFNLTPSEILKQADDVVALSKQVYDNVAAVPLDEVTYEKVIAPLANLEAEEFSKIQECVFPRLVAVSKDVRDASAEAEKRIEGQIAKCRMREDVYLAVKAFAEKQEPLGAEAERYVNRLVRDFERLGINLGKEERAEVNFLHSSIEEHSRIFQQNLEEENLRLYFTEAELDGLPADFIKGLKKGKDGKLEVSLKYPHYAPIMERCKVGATRRAVGTAYDKRCMKENVPILEKVVAMRHSMAQLLGYKNYAEYATSIRMAKTPEKVKEFLETISERMSGLARIELRKLKAMKKAEEGSDEFGMADLRYYICKAEESELKVDFNQVKLYFPIEVVTQGLLKIFQDLLGLRFKELERPQVWYSEVQLFAVLEAETGELMGYFYLDLYPRDGKYSQTCVCSLQSGCVRGNGTRQLPVVAMLANFTRPTKGKPSLLTHEEVVNYFHEFGHVMHHICSRASFARFTGLRGEEDFVEAPSQMLENWCFEAPALKLMSGYYKDTKQPIPSEFCVALSKKRRSCSAILTKRQILLGLFDQGIHTTNKVDTTALLRKLHSEVMEGMHMDDGTNFGASFSHLMGGYDGGYYGYLWSEVYSSDMFATKFKLNILSRIAGREYRDKVLQPGACKDGTEILEDFLGRAPSEDAFLRRKGVL
ncbi:unnamed protein product [Calypogeia fissa]